MSGRVLAPVPMIVVAVALSLIPGEAVGQARAGGNAKPDAQSPAKTWAPPRTANGQPDLQGLWLNNSATPLERPKALEGKQTLSDEEVAELKRRAARLFDVNGNSDFAGGDAVFLAALANAEEFRNPNATGSSVTMVEREFDNRTSLIVEPPDGRIPPLTPAAQRRQAAAEAAAQRPPAGPEDLSLMNRCITFGVPRLGGNASSYNSYYEIVQHPGYVVLLGEAIHDARVIPLDGRPHLPANIRLWHGDSVGRWEGSTLVVDTTNFSAKSNFMGSSEHLHLVERFTRVDADTISYEITLDDATTWTRPWAAVVRLKKTGDKMFEYACHEGNYDIVRTILSGAHADGPAADRR
jgi:hypothetical protein